MKILNIWNHHLDFFAEVALSAKISLTTNSAASLTMKFVQGLWLKWSEKRQSFLNETNEWGWCCCCYRWIQWPSWVKTSVSRVFEGVYVGSQGTLICILPFFDVFRVFTWNWIVAIIAAFCSSKILNTSSLIHVVVFYLSIWVFSQSGPLPTSTQPNSSCNECFKNRPL